MQKIKSKNTIKSITITAIFNTLIAFVLTYMIEVGKSFLDVFLIAQFIGLSICIFVTIGINLVEKKTNLWPPTGIIAGLIFGIISGSLLSLGYLFFVRDVAFDYFIKQIFSSIFVFGIVFGAPIIYFFISREQLIESEKQIQQEKIQRLTMEKEAAMTTLRLLQAQIEPHFLFNTLSNVIALFDIDMEKAKHMLIDINEYLRICLERTRQEMITLDQELGLVRKYLDIFKIRMGERLSYKIDDRTGSEEIAFPPLIIQPLVENSIKYGLEPKVDGGSITIDCQIQNNTLEIVITDTGKGLDEDVNEAGIGINNVSRRLESIYGNDAILTMKQNHPTGIKSIIKVPL